MNLRILHCSFINQPSASRSFSQLFDLKTSKTAEKDEFRGKKANSAVNSTAWFVKTKIPRSAENCGQLLIIARLRKLMITGRQTIYLVSISKVFLYKTHIASFILIL